MVVWGGCPPPVATLQSLTPIPPPRQRTQCDGLVYTVGWRLRLLSMVSNTTTASWDSVEGTGCCLRGEGNARRVLSPSSPEYRAQGVGRPPKVARPWPSPRSRRIALAENFHVSRSSHKRVDDSQTRRRDIHHLSVVSSSPEILTVPFYDAYTRLFLFRCIERFSNRGVGVATHHATRHRV